MRKPGSNERPDWPLAIIVGAGGMGMAIARRVGQAARLLLVDRSAERLDQQVQALNGDGYDARSFRCDVTENNSVSEMAAFAAALAPIQLVVHVVGLSPSMGDFRTLMAVNLCGAERVARALLPHLGAGACGIFISSLAGHMKPLTAAEQSVLDDPLAPDFIERLEASLSEPLTSTLAYQLSKTALNRMCQKKAFEWAERGARIVSLSPGLIATPMGALEFERQPMKYDLLAKTPLQREGTMLEIANVVEFLASDKASFISGTDILVDGGLHGTLKTKL